MSENKASKYNLRKVEWNGYKIDQWDASDWKKWKSKVGKSDKQVELEREYLRIKHAIAQANLALSFDKVKIKLKMTGTQSIALQGTFPCKPGDVGKNNSNNKQYTISLGFCANDIGLKKAVAKARELDLLLITNQFQWVPELLGKKAQKIYLKLEGNPDKAIQELVCDYEKEFWKTHQRNRQSLRTWESHYIRHLKKLPQNVTISDAAIEEALNKTKPHTSSRFYLIWQLKKFCSFCNFDGSKLIESYATPLPKSSPRKVPSDDEIIAAFHQVGSPLSPHASKYNIGLPSEWKWIYGMLATYGLRPHELFAIDIDAFCNPKNTFHLVTLNPELTQGTKTGERTCGVPPLYPHWIELFDLKDVKLINSGGNLNNKTARIHVKFRNAGLSFKPYDLRHAYALRGHRLRVPIKTMADYMGHTVEEHTKTYQRWMNEDTNLEIYKEVVINRNGTSKEALKERIKELETENLALKAENESLKGILVKHRLDEMLM